VEPLRDPFALNNMHRYLYAVGGRGYVRKLQFLSLPLQSFLSTAMFSLDCCAVQKKRQFNSYTILYVLIPVVSQSFAYK
jgi:hypothetical protein